MTGCMVALVAGFHQAKQHTGTGQQTVMVANQALLRCSSHRVLMSKLQELAAASLSLGLPGDPLSQVNMVVCWLGALWMAVGSIVMHAWR